MLQMIPVVIAAHSDRSGRENRKKAKPPTAWMRSSAMAANHVFFGMQTTLVLR